MVDSGAGALDAARLVALVDELAVELAAVPEERFTARSAADWTAAEVIGHMTEMLPYWARIAAEVAAQPGSAFGREIDDPDRVGAVTTANNTPRGEALAGLRQAARTAAAILAVQSDTARSVSGVHPVRGEMSVATMIDQLVMTHAEGHVRQALQAAGVIAADSAH